MMRLSDALGIKNKQVVSFVGGGGKTTSMFRLANELVAQGKRVVTTTTTRIFAVQIQLAPQVLRIETKDWGENEGWKKLSTAIREALVKYPHVLVIGATTEQGKALGVDPALVDRIIELDEVDAVLVEADGSRMRPFKAPGEHEPVVPLCTTLLVPIVGIDAVGKTLEDAHVHRPERISILAGIPHATILTAEHVAAVIGNAQGGLRNKPGRARVIPLINKVESREQLSNAYKIAELLLKNNEIVAVAIGAVKNLQSPVSCVQSRVAAVILAAGGSTRMQGQVKQLLPWGDTTFVGNAVRVARQSRVSEIVVVTGNRAPEVTMELQAATDVRIVHNPDWATGRASSVRVGIRALAQTVAGAIFINADQPFLTAQVIDAILARFAETRAPVIVPTYQGAAGSPVLFARELFDELTALQGEQGGRDILQKYEYVSSKVEIEDVRAALDLDTPEEYQHARGLGI